MSTTLNKILADLATAISISILLFGGYFLSIGPVAVFANADGAYSGAETGGEEYETTFTPVTLNNPLNGIDSLEDLLVAILNIFIVLMIPVIVFFIIYAGFKYVTAQGNSHSLEEAHRTLLYAIIGGVLILAAVAIADIIRNTVDAFIVP